MAPHVLAICADRVALAIALVVGGDGRRHPSGRGGALRCVVADPLRWLVVVSLLVCLCAAGGTEKITVRDRRAMMMSEVRAYAG